MRGTGTLKGANPKLSTYMSAVYCLVFRVSARCTEELTVVRVNGCLEYRYVGPNHQRLQVKRRTHC